MIDAVAELDLSAFYGAYRDDGHGRPAYDPAMMVALVVYGYARGTRSSRAIERACEDDVAFRVVVANHAPIARFVERHQDALRAVRRRARAVRARPYSSPAVLGAVDELPQPGERGLRVAVIAVVVAQASASPVLARLRDVAAQSITRRMPPAAMRAIRSPVCV